MTSLGKWNQIARDVSKKLKKADFMAGQISNLYSGNNKNWSKSKTSKKKWRNSRKRRRKCYRITTWPS